MRTFTTVHDFKLHERVETHPASDAWMSGDRYGEIVKLGRVLVHVKMDRSGRTLKMSYGNVQHIDRS